MLLKSGRSDAAYKCHIIVGNGCRRYGWISGNNKVILRKRPGSASVGYDLNAAVVPTKRNAAYRGSCWNLIVSGMEETITCAENTIRKNGRKSSNISVKKYHHKPTLGVRSGTRMDAPQVDFSHWASPTTKVESNPNAASRKPKRMPYSGIVLHRVKALGPIRDDVGDDSSRTEIGMNSKPENSELCVRIASADRAAREFPLDADEMTKSVNALSKDEVDNAKEGKTIYGFNR